MIEQQSIIILYYYIILLYLHGIEYLYTYVLGRWGCANPGFLPLMYSME